MKREINNNKLDEYIKAVKKGVERCFASGDEKNIAVGCAEPILFQQIIEDIIIEELIKDGYNARKVAEGPGFMVTRKE